MLACARMEQAYSYSPSVSFFAHLSISYEWMSVYYVVRCKASHTTGAAMKRGNSETLLNYHITVVRERWYG